MSGTASDTGPTDTGRKEHRSKRRTSKQLREALASVEEERDALQSVADQLNERVAQLEDDRLRLMAEMENMHKRSQRRLQEDRWSLLAEITRPLLEVADNLQRAADAGEGTGADEATVSGVRMVHDQLLEVLSRYGVVPIEAVGQPFDFNMHEAIAHEASEGARENEVIAEVSRGYVLNGRLLRPSRVVVARVEGSDDE